MSTTGLCGEYATDATHRVADEWREAARAWVISDLRMKVDKPAAAYP